MVSNPVPPLLVSISLPEELPYPLPAPRFHLRQSVYWAYVPTHDWGCVVGMVWADAASTQATGYHYAIQLDPQSPSYADGIRSDWAFEDDLELFPVHDTTNGQQEH